MGVEGKASKGMAGILALREDSGKPAVLPLQMALPTVKGESGLLLPDVDVVLPSSPTTLFFHALDSGVSS